MSITIDLSGHRAWVTGGASGIGAAIVSALGHAGARVVSLDRSHPAVPLSAGSALGPVTCTHLDVRDGAEVEAVARELVAAELEPDIVVNSAGLASDAPVWKLRDEQWSEVLDVNLTGAFRVVRAVAPSMRERRGGAGRSSTSRRSTASAASSDRPITPRRRAG